MPKANSKTKHGAGKLCRAHCHVHEGASSGATQRTTLQTRPHSSGDPGGQGTGRHGLSHTTCLSFGTKPCDHPLKTKKEKEAARGEEKVPTPAADRGGIWEPGAWALAPRGALRASASLARGPGAAPGFPQATREVSNGGPSVCRQGSAWTVRVGKRSRGDPTESCKVPKGCDSPPWVPSSLQGTRRDAGHHRHSLR